MQDKYAVIGNPIGHSKSPFIHAEFAKQTQQALTYRAELVEIGKISEFVQDFRNSGGKGLNITVPFKLDAWQIAQKLSERAQRAGAVNTLSLNDNNILGDTTDGTGLLNDLVNNHQLKLKQKNILVLGAGGAVRGVLEPLLKTAAAQLVIANRTVEKAIQLADDFTDLGNITGCGFSDLGDEKFDLIINGTSASLSGKLLPLPDNILNDDAACYDMMYGATDTTFMRWAKQQGAKNIFDGLGMLVEQAAESFFIWRGVRPQTQDVIALLRQQLVSG